MSIYYIKIEKKQENSSSYKKILINTFKTIENNVVSRETMFGLVDFDEK